MDFIMIPAIFGIVTLGFYKLFELFVCKKERLLIIEKMGEKFTPEMLGNKINLSSVGNVSFSALKFGCLFVGLGLGLLVAFCIHYNFVDFLNKGWDTRSVVYGSCVLLFGGAGLLTSFLIELKISKK